MRKYLLTASLLTALLVTGCAQEPQTESAMPVTPDSISASDDAAPENTLTAKTQTAPPSEISTLPELYQGLSATEISRAEIEELRALKEKINARNNAHQKAMSVWRKEDTSRRGPRPIWERTELSPEKSARLKQLQEKLKNAQIRKRYESLDPTVLTAAEVQEIILLEQAQAKTMSDYQDKITAWTQADPSTRGAQPQMEMSDLLGEDTRLMELQMKVQNVQRMDTLKSQLKEQSEKYNIALSDSEMAELMELQKEQMEFELEISKAMIEAQKNSEISGDILSEEEIFNRFPKPLLERMMTIKTREDAIRAPLRAAQKAERLQERYTKLSEESGVPILSGEMAEIIALNTERDDIQDNTEMEAIRKWLTEDGGIPDGDFLPNDEDYARLKEIEARLDAISAPMTEAKNAALEADNPALRQQRLEREAREKWQKDWRDKKQSGEVPAGTPLTSPTYAELQDRVKDYDTKLEIRAEKVGFAVPDSDIERLTALNDQMMGFRKSVYETERDGSSHVKGQYGQKTQTFETAARMYKIKLIERKQQEILTGLSEAEAFQNGSAQNRASDSGKVPFEYHNFGQVTDNTTIETMIESFRMNDIEISQSEIDDLRAFERELKGR